MSLLFPSSNPEEERSRELTDFHNQGQEDASKGEHNNPHEPWEVALYATLGGDPDVLTNENEAYEKGHDHGLEQKSSSLW